MYGKPDLALDRARSVHTLAAWAAPPGGEVTRTGKDPARENRAAGKGTRNEPGSVRN
jgi:hypothetical protein